MAEALKISSYNVHSCVGTDNHYSVNRVAYTISQTTSDVVCLQEVEANLHPSQDVQTRVWSHPHHDDQPSLLAELAGYPYHAFAPAIRSKASGWKEMHKSVSDESCTDFGEFGIAILSKHPIVRIISHQYKRYRHKTLRNTMACLVSLPDESSIWIVNTHLGCHFIGREQHAQAVELVSFIQSLDTAKSRSVIVCGDFNALPMYRCIRYMRQCDFHDLWEWRGQGSGGTFPSMSSVLGLPFCARRLIRLDYIFVVGNQQAGLFCNNIYVHDTGVDTSLASDHLPICAVLILGSVDGS